MAKISKTAKETKTVPAASPASRLMEPWREMDRMFEDFFDRRFPTLPRLLSRDERVGFLRPHVDVKETDKAVVISAELPGLNDQDVDVELRDGVLVIKGEKKVETEKDEDNFHLTERRYGSFQRSFRVPESVDDAKVQAAFENGVLTVTLPKRTEAVKPAKKIKVAKKS